MDQQRIPPRTLFASMAIIVGAYLAATFCQISCTALIGWLFFPDVFSRWLEKPRTPEAYAAQIDLLMPANLFWISAGITAVISIGLGWLIVRLTRFAPNGHAIFAALLIGLSHMQAAASNPPAMKWMGLVGMAMFPLAILLGARLGIRTRQEALLDHAANDVE